ncbi:hypothetical protein HO133_009371 [Letharia lupina]|uniref:Protein phosphatase 4 core regulatory subunit R2 n=1 Tax=Letharia lupina TaxID=560253 RepID=A0A8H6FFK5_9LECA|nr:uncharacterized protein HO133_009371 [Letharia lupina]KAF6226505.1 hypothetical protein HO133_009371 [Letharia lupina]
MASDDALLEELTKDGKMDYAEWPGLLDRLLPRLDHIAYNDFPTPSIPLPGSLPPSLKEEHVSVKREPPLKEEPFRERPSFQEESGDTKQEAPENEEQAGIKADPSIEDSKSTIKTESSPTTDNAALPPANTLPPPLLSLLSTIQSTLRSGFPTAPPHTAQRLAELLLYPTNHYKTLPSYLRALDRIVSVASPASVFPLATLTPAATTNGRLLNGTSSPSPGSADKDFIGGAELTEIPWIRLTGSPTPIHNGPTSDLRTESTSVIDGPNGAGSVETVTVNVNGVHSAHPRDDSNISHGITQGELLRQEQEAGIVPVPAPTPNGRVTRSSAAASAAATRAVGGDVENILDSEEIEPVHARGPDVIGMEDMGPQTPRSGLAGGIDLEGALGRRGEGETMAATVGRAADEEEEKGDGKDETKDGDGDIVVADADGVAEGDDGAADESGENKGPDAVDSTTL